jgi:ubiquitin carboxyl-terminal hydrolase 9/24
VCTTPATLTAAFDLLVSLCTACPANLREAAHILTEMFYTDKEDALQEWEYLPPVGPRPNNGFVGLKNAGATCYMNSVLQQLYMIDNVREGVLSVDGACNDPDEDFSGEEREDELVGGAEDMADDNDEASKREYNIIILKQVQAIFAHLALTRQQFYVPRGLWRHFRMFQGEPVNLREQQDAVEFFMRLIDLVDEAMKGLGFEQRMTKVLGGVFSDQKICRTCPHRYSREQPFSVLNVDIKNFSTLADSLHEYVKGELLDGSNAYYCERCDKKVDTIKRLCVKKLPPVLVIQLKRFDYDYERECAIKFNDYFEFPRELDMEPYTVAGLAKIEGEPLDCDDIDLNSASDASMSKYRLRGMVVHSGQASGGHYYSYIRCSRGWFKFDDGDVSEARMDDDEELKAQCYGGEYMSEVFDPMLKRMSYRKQKRWWNAYMLFYGRCDIEDASASVETDQLVAQMANVSLAPQETSRRGVTCKIPLAIERSIQKQNVRFMHHKNQYSAEYFQFMRKLIGCNGPYVVQATQQQQQQVGQGSSAVALQEQVLPDLEDLAMTTIQLASKFLFLSGFRTKKSLRGAAQEWYEILSVYFRFSKQVSEINST